MSSARPALSELALAWSPDSAGATPDSADGATTSVLGFARTSTGKRKRAPPNAKPPPAPPRPARASAAPLRAHLRATLATWSAALTALQPKCVVSEAAVDRGVGLALAYARAAPAGPLPPAAAAGAFWVAVKTEGTRCAVPSRGLLARATGVDAGALGAAELDVLLALRFDVYSGELTRA